MRRFWTLGTCWATLALLFLGVACGDSDSTGTAEQSDTGTSADGGADTGTTLDTGQVNADTGQAEDTGQVDTGSDDEDTSVVDTGIEDVADDSGSDTGNVGDDAGGDAASDLADASDTAVTDAFDEPDVMDEPDLLPGPGPITIVVQRVGGDGPLIEGAEVLFHSPEGELLGRDTTDGTGTATWDEFPQGGGVTVLTYLVETARGRPHYRLRTVMGLAPDDTYDLFTPYGGLGIRIPRPNGSLWVDAALPDSISGTADVVVMTDGCRQFRQAVQANPNATMEFPTYNVCPEPDDLHKLALWAFDTEGSLLGSAFIDGVPRVAMGEEPTVEQVVSPESWQVPGTSFVTTINGAPESTAVKLWVSAATDDLAHRYISAGPEEGDGSVLGVDEMLDWEFPHVEAFHRDLYMDLGFPTLDSERENQEADLWIRQPNGPLDVDLGTLVEPPITSVVTTVSDVDQSVTVAVNADSALKANYVRAAITWSGTESLTTYWVWVGEMPESGSITTPELPSAEDYPDIVNYFPGMDAGENASVELINIDAGDWDPRGDLWRYLWDGPGILADRGMLDRFLVFTTYVSGVVK